MAFEEAARAIKRGDSQALQELIAPNTTLDAHDSNGDTLLLLACRSKNAAAVHILIWQGANPNARAKSGMTCLQESALVGDMESIDELIAGGAALEAHEPRTGWTALHFAANSDNDAVVQALLVAGANVDARDAKGNTPLMIAAFKARARNVEILANYGAQLNAKNSNGLTALDAARSPTSIRTDDEKQAIALILRILNREQGKR